MRNLYKYTKLYSHAEPILTEGDVFKIWIPLKRDANIIANGVNSGVNGVNNGVNHLDEDKDLLERLLTIVANDPKSTQAKLAEDLGVSKRTVQRLTDTLKEQGKLERIDGTRGYWKVKTGKWTPNGVPATVKHLLMDNEINNELDHKLLQQKCSRLCLQYF